MNAQKQMEAMARADGFEHLKYDPDTMMRGSQGMWTGVHPTRPTQIPDYTTDNAIDRMVRGLEERIVQWEYSLQLQIITSGILDGKSGAELTLNAVLATAAQKVEAYLKAIGSWVDDTKEGE